MTPEEAAKKLIELDARKPAIKAYYEEVAECLEILGVDAHFQDDEDGTVFLVEEQTGRFVTFDKLRYVRTKKADEVRGELSKKRAKELGYDVE